MATLKHDKVNTGGVAFFTSGSNEWRVNFDDCSSPAVNLWEDVSAITTQTFVLSDPIGFVDHYTSNPLGLVYPPPQTPGRVFTIDLIGGQGDSLGSFSDDDGATYLPGGNGGPGQGPDHETLGGGPYSGTPPANASYPATGTKNAIYYCSQDIVAAFCARTDDGGITYGPSVHISSVANCGLETNIHGHVKVTPSTTQTAASGQAGAVYVPNRDCNGVQSVIVSVDNGITWAVHPVQNGTSTAQPGTVGSGDDPAVVLNRGSGGGQLIMAAATVAWRWLHNGYGARGA